MVIKIIKQNRLLFIILAIVIIILIISALILFFSPKKENTSIQNKSIGIANPASVYCKENGGTLEIRSDEQGNQYGVCLKNGKECEEWKLFREECAL